MFNGIIKNKGKISQIKRNKNNCYLEVISKIKFNNNDIGSSVSCSGVCLTLEGYKRGIMKFFISKETLSKTIFKYSKKNDIINLEKPIKFGDPISGHFVQGHVDTTSRVVNIKIIGKSWLINFKLGKNFIKYIVTKGSITINGVSLTIAKIFKNGFQIAIIPKTLQLTNLINLRENDLVNVEFDILGKYIKGRS